jgi:predicted nucleic acid-binding Zn ribbon protein
MPTPRVDYTKRPRRTCEVCPKPLPKTARAHARACSPRCRRVLHRREHPTAAKPLSVGGLNGARQEPQDERARFPGNRLPDDLIARPEASYGLDPEMAGYNPQYPSSVSPGSVTSRPGSVTKPDDGLRWIDRWGFIHRAPAGTRSQLPGRYC